MTREDCLKILEAYGAPEHVKRHCLGVGDAAREIGFALSEAGFRKAADVGGGPLDTDVIMTAGYLHDIARAGKDHDLVGAEIVTPIDAAAGDVVARHMKLIFPEDPARITEADIVSLADRTVREDHYVGYEARMADLLRRYADQPEVVARVHKNMDLALRLIAWIEDFCGRDFQQIATGGAVRIEPLLERVERPGRYIGGEIGSVRKDWHADAVRFCFAFPDLYEIGMSYTGFQILYGLLNAQPGALCERVFAPAQDMEKALLEGDAPLFSLESRQPVRVFDVIGFTLQYELSYTNVVRMLLLARVPLYTSMRGEADPFVIAGGPCCANPEPMAPFFDLFCVGDGEDTLLALCEKLRLWKAEKAAGGNVVRADFLKAAAEIEGVYVPSLADAGKQPVVRRAVVEDLENAFFPARPVVPHIESVHDRAAVEIMRGCYRSCRFCQAGFACAKVRRRSPEKIKALLKEALANTGYDEVSLLSLSTGDYPGIERLVTDLMQELAPMDVSLSLPSLRLDSLKAETLEKIAEYKRTSLTFAPEAGTQRLRDVLHKQITEEDLMRVLEIALPLGFQKFKFYFMIGLPTETQEDLDGIAGLACAAIAKAKALGAEHGVKYNFHLTVSVSNFVPKPGTPFERERGCGEAELLEKIYYLKEAVRRAKGANFRYHDTRMSHIEMLLAKGDRSAAAVIERAARDGAGFDSWREYFDYENWLRAFEACGVPAEDRYTGLDAALPWAFIEGGKEYGREG